MKLGDTVQLKSGGPKMTITSVNPSKMEVRCSWHTDDASADLQSAVFAAATLHLTKQAAE